MTVPRERSSATRRAYNFLYALIQPKLTPGVPWYVRYWAGRILKHYPVPVEIDMTAEGNFGLWDKLPEQDMPADFDWTNVPPKPKRLPKKRP